MEQMHDISFEQMKDGSIRLEQQCGIDEPNVIYLHQEQLKFITRRMVGMSETTAAQVEELERRLSILASDLEFIVKDASFRRQVIQNCCDGIELMTRLDALLDLAFEFNGGRLTPRMPQAAPSSVANDTPNTNAPANKQNAASSESSRQLGLDV